MKKKLAFGGFLFAILTLMSSQALAHTQWLLPSSTQVQAPTSVEKPAYATVDAGASEAVFVADHVALKLDNVSIIDPNGRNVEPENKAIGKLRSVFDVKMEKEGSYRVAIDNSSVFASYKIGEEQKRARGASEEEVRKSIPQDAKDVQVSKSFSRIETMITAGKPSALKPLGKGIEIFPLQPVSDLVVGDKARFKVLKDGMALKATVIKIIPGGVKQRGELGDFSATTDANGEIAIDWKYAGYHHLSVSYPPMAASAGMGDNNGAKPTMGNNAAPTANVVNTTQPPRPPMPPLRYNYALTVDVAPQ